MKKESLILFGGIAVSALIFMFAVNTPVTHADEEYAGSCKEIGKLCDQFGRSFYFEEAADKPGYMAYACSGFPSQGTRNDAVTMMTEKGYPWTDRGQSDDGKYFFNGYCKLDDIPMMD